MLTELDCPICGYSAWGNREGANILMKKHMRKHINAKSKLKCLKSN